MKRIAMTLALLLAVLSGGLNQAQAQRQEKEDKSIPLMLQSNTLKNMVGIISRQVSRRYDLNEDQAATAKSMMEDGTMDFVNKHYEELITIVPEFQNMRNRVINGDDPSPAEVQKMAKRLLPIYKEATDMIISKNEQFAEILDPKQRRMHKKDMDKMKRNVSQMNEKMERWEKGEYEAGEFLSHKSKRKTRRSTPKKPEVMSPTSLDFWELYVKTFSDAFQLDAGQVTLAYSVLNDLKAQAQAYRKDHIDEITELENKIAAITTATTQPTKEQSATLKELQEKLTKANQPFFDMFETLKIKLMDIPTDAQRKAAQEILGGAEEEAKETTTKATTKPAAK